MTVIEMARAAGFDVVGDLYGEDALIAKITRLVELEREACAQVAETAPDLLQNSTFDGVAAAIRARGSND